MHISLKLIKRFITAVAAIAGLTMAGGAVAAPQTAPEAAPMPHAAVRTIKQDVRKVATPEAAKALEADGYNCSADAAPVKKKVKTPGFIKKRIAKKHPVVAKTDHKPHKTFKAAAKAHKKHKVKPAVAKAPAVKPATAAASTFTCVRPIKGIMPPVMGAFKAPPAPMSVPPPPAGNGVSPGPGFVPPGPGYFVPPVVPGGTTPWSNGGGGSGYVPPYIGPGGGGYVPPIVIIPPGGSGSQPPVVPPGVSPPVVVPPVPPVVVPPAPPPQPPKPPVNPPVKEYCDKLKPGGGLTGYDPACHPPGEPPVVVPPTPPKPPEDYCKLFKPGGPLAGTPDPACNPDGPKPPPPPVQDCLNTPSLPQCQVPHTVPEPGTGTMALSAVAAMALVLFRRGKRPVVPANTLRPM